MKLRGRRGRGFRYSRWDGTQTGFDLDADALLEEMSDDLLYHGDLNAALRRLLQQGFRDRNDERLMGLREMLERLRQRRRDELERRDLGGVYDDVAEKLQEVVEQERQGIDRRLDEARQSGDQRRQEILEELAQQRRQTLDELLEQMAQSMAQMQQLLNSMTPEQRAQLQGLAQALLEDLDLRWQVDELARNLQNAFPNMPWNNSMNFSGDDPMQFGQMPGLLDMLGDIDDLEHLLQSATQPGELAEVDVDKARELLGDDAARSLERLRELARMLEEAGLIEQREGRLELTPKGIRAIGQQALGDLYRKLLKDRAGRHEIERSGVGNERAFEHKPYEFGDPFHLNVEETVKNAIWRQGSGTPVTLAPTDFEVERTELLTRSSTVLLLDVSLSMPMRDNFLSAKKVAMALHALITTKFPRDYFGLVSFGRVAREVKPELLPEMSWDFEWGTNMQHALMLARKQLAREGGTKQVIMVTDGEPTAHIEGGEAYFQYPPSPVTIEETLKEVMRCTREGIRINTFMLDESYYLRSFVERMMRMNKGRAFFTTPDTLGDYVLVDFLEQKRESRRAS